MCTALVDMTCNLIQYAHGVQRSLVHNTNNNV